MNSDLKVALQQSFFSFARKAFLEKFGDPLGKQPYIRYLCYRLEQLARRDVKRLVINLPPRHLKTNLSSVWLPAWILGTRPRARILEITYGEKLAQEISYNVRATMRSSWYKKVFTTRLAVDRSRVDDFVTTAGGGLYAASIEGSLTGYGADFIIIDDPSEITDAGHPEKLARVCQRYDGLIESRLNDPQDGCIAIIAHRISEADLSGHAIAAGGFRKIILPLIAPRTVDYDCGNGRVWHREKGTFLREKSWSRQQIEKKRRAMVNPDFETLFQQDPGGRRTFRIREDHFLLFTRDMLPPNLLTVVSVDPGQTDGPTNSFWVAQVWTRYEDRHFLLFQLRERTTYQKFQSALRNVIGKYRASAVLIEKAAGGYALISASLPTFRTKLFEIRPDRRSKVERLLAHRKIIRSNQIMLPAGAWWVGDYIAEFVAFPSGQSDDQVDATTQYLDFAVQNPHLEPPPRRIGGSVANSSGFFTGAGPGSVRPSAEIPGAVLVRYPRWPFRW